MQHSSTGSPHGKIWYQVYPQAQPRINNVNALNGHGNFAGMLRYTVPYVAALGVDLVYMGPFFASPKQSMDQYYEVLGHREIDPRFGTLNEFIALKESFHKHNIRLLIDFPICTLSVHSLPFRASSDPTHPQHQLYKDWFIWQTLSPDGSPINNWKGFTRETVWRFNKKRQETYLAWFYPSQANMNLRHEPVQSYFLDAVDFWLKTVGVDGMRVDAVGRLFNHQVSHEKPCNYSELPGTSELDLPWDRYDNSEVAHLPETFEFLAKIQKRYPDRILVPEIAAGGDDFVAGKRGLDVGLPYVYTAEGFESRSLNSEDFIRLAQNISDQFGSQHVLSIGGHDNARLYDRAAPANADRQRYHLYALATGIALPGPFLTYQGYELGWRDSQEHLEDLAMSGNFPADRLDLLRRDGSRTPFTYESEWDSTGWDYLPPDPLHLENAVNIQEQRADSCLSQTRALFEFAKGFSAVLTGGAIDIITYSQAPDIIAWIRRDNDEEILFVANGTALQLTHKVNLSRLVSKSLSLLHGSSEVISLDHYLEITLLPHGYGFFRVHGD